MKATTETAFVPDLVSLALRWRRCPVRQFVPRLALR